MNLLHRRLHWPSNTEAKVIAVTSIHPSLRGQNVGGLL